MIEIKFRAWDYHNILCKNIMYSWEMLQKNNIQYFTNNELFKGRIIMQFSGYQDVNGVDVYEGDVLYEKYKDKMEEAGYGELKLEVAFKDGCFGCIGETTGKLLPFYEYPPNNMEVIGNIYELKHLIES